MTVTKEIKKLQIKHSFNIAKPMAFEVVEDLVRVHGLNTEISGFF